jgi:hypothetical protein
MALALTARDQLAALAAGARRRGRHLPLCEAVQRYRSGWPCVCVALTMGRIQAAQAGSPATKNTATSMRPVSSALPDAPPAVSQAAAAVPTKEMTASTALCTLLRSSSDDPRESGGAAYRGLVLAIGQSLRQFIAQTPHRRMTGEHPSPGDLLQDIVSSIADELRNAAPAAVAHRAPLREASAVAPNRRAAACLHIDGPEDEPIELDVDVSVTCPCGHTAHKRAQLYKERDVESVMCNACGAEFDVSIVVGITFTAAARQTSADILSVARQPEPSPASPRPHTATLGRTARPATVAREGSR